MNTTKLFEDLWRLVKNLNKTFSQLGKAPKQTINLAIVVLVGFLLWSWVDATFFRSEFEFLAGPQKSAGNGYAKSIIKHFNKSNGTPLRRNKMQGVYSDGFMDNQRQIANDETGKLVAFGQIGFGDSANTRVLLPLEFNYLHIICRNGLYDEIVSGHQDWATKYAASIDASQADKEKRKLVDKRLGLFELLYVYEQILEEERNGSAEVTQPSTLQRLFGIKPESKRSNTGSRKLKPLRIAAGSPGSGTRHLALEIFKHFGIEFRANGLSSTGSYFLNGNVSIDSTQNMLMDGGVDIVFSLNPADGSYLKKFQNHGFLLDLGDHANAISQQVSDTVLVHTMPDGLYGEPIPRFPIAETGIEIDAPFGKGKWDLWRPRFCEEVQVLKTRRALLCSKHMSSQHGYSIAVAARQALSDVIPGIDWDNLDTPPKSKLASIVRYHEGAKLLREDKVPGILDWLLVQWEKFRSLFLVTTLTIMLGWLNKKFEKSAADEDGESDETPAPTPVDDPQSESASSAEQAPDEATTTVIGSEIQTLKSSAFGMTPEEAAYRRVSTAIDNLQIELTLESKQLSKSKFREWQRKLKSLNRLIATMTAEEKITAEHGEILLAGSSELNVLFETEFVAKTTPKS